MVLRTPFAGVGRSRRPFNRIYARIQNNKIFFYLRLLLRYVVTILDLLRRSRLKVLLLTLFIIALTLIFRNNFYSLKDGYLIGSNSNNNRDRFVGHGSRFYEQDEDYYASADLFDLDLFDYDLDELYEEGLLMSLQHTSMDDDSDDDILFENDYIRINKNITIDELNERKEEVINQKVKSRIKDLKDEWLKSNFSKQHPNIKFEDALEGFTAESLARYGFKPKGSLVMYISDSDLEDIIRTIESVQIRFNNWVQYPWVLISVDGKEYNDVDWMDKLRESDLFDNAKNGKIKVNFETVSGQYWGMPEWIDVGKLAKSRNKLWLEPHIDSTEYRIWTRYFTGFLPLENFMLEYDWMWYIKPGTVLSCEVDYDVFRVMQDSGKLIGVSGSFKIENLGDFDFEKSYKNLKDKHQDMIREDNLESFLLERNDQNNDDKKFDKCELLMESFSLSNLNFWRSETYQNYFEIIDKEGPIFYNGWTINKVQTLAITLLMSQNSFKFFDNLGFENDDYVNCPIDDLVYNTYRCECDQGEDMTFVDNTCSRKFYDILGLQFPDSWEKHTNYLRSLKLKQ